MRKIFLFLFVCLECYLFCDLSLAPVSYKGRIRPFQVSAEALFYELYHAKKIDIEDAHLFQEKDAMMAISQLYLDGAEKWKSLPFIWVGDNRVKKLLGLSSDKKHFSFEVLQDSFLSNLEATKTILHHLFLKGESALKELDADLLVKNFTIIKEAKSSPWNTLKSGESFFATHYDAKLAESLIQVLKRMNLFASFKGIEHLDKAPLKEDLHFHFLPSKNLKEKWYGLSSLLHYKSNFTLYQESSFKEIQKSFFSWIKDPKNESQAFGQALLQGYREIEKKPFLKGANQKTFYPSLSQLKLEVAYSSLPIIPFALFGYLASSFFLLAFFKNKRARFLGYSFFAIAFVLHLTALLIRSWVLMRPPVSNMFETVIYVPIVSAIAGVFLSKKDQSEWPLIASAILSAILLTLSEISHLNADMENVQAVLNSNFWLTVHVLMIVGSYGILILAGVLGHFYLFMPKKGLEKCILQSLYLGTALLIPGTILGGIWAAQSWGRFWDWDPKESWAFISICTYLILIHLYRFNKIAAWGLSIGSILGLAVISFTWYGVNYILGTGMHTYGFGSGSHVYYAFFLLAESFFLIYMARRRGRAVQKSLV